MTNLLFYFIYGSANRTSAIPRHLDRSGEISTFPAQNNEISPLPYAPVEMKLKNGCHTQLHRHPSQTAF